MIDLLIAMIGLIIGAIVAVVSTVIHTVVMLVLLPFAFLRRRKPNTEVSTVENNLSVPSRGDSARALEERTMPTAEDFKREIHRTMLEAQNAGKELVLINAGELHRRVGGYPGTNHRMPNCCQVMRAQMLDSADFVLDAPPSGLGATLTIAYRVPRSDWG
jgi:hypothetical protein